MSRVTVILADSDLGYITSVSNFIRTSELSSQLAVKYFSNQADLEAYLKGTTQTNLLLTTAELMPENTVSVETVIVLAETPKEQVLSKESLLKYQSLTSLFSKALEIYYQQHQLVKPIRSAGGSTKVVSVYSPIGGSGKTILAVNLARLIASEGQRVFYLNLELISSMPLFFKTEEVADSSEVFYYSKARPEELAYKMETLTRRDRNVDYFNIKSIPEEMIDLAAKDTEAIISALVQRDVYDYIIIDLDSSLDERVLASLRMSHLTLWPLVVDIQSFYKTKMALEGYKRILKDDDLEHKIAFVLNKFLGERQIPAELHEFGLDTSFALPYVSEWKAVGNSQLLTTHSFFNDQIRKLYQLLLEHNRGVEIG
ncbi:AAA family ATPase [Neobacillus niacini]|uniref:AAA family ATPase n=1 Tax=Neobacillus niacini TaxID=86668 RepID=UPI0021CAE3CE|nr:AAA family ATPase [Neobacillus niacini]MCM3768624.1 AAA family ATPase [Neobacillus niacini]